MKYILVIPARYQSSRFPGKPLIDIDGKSMIKRVYEQCVKAVDPSLIYVATEDQRIKEHCEKNSIQCLITSNNCLTGTDRVGEVAKMIEADYYINIQGDEPLVHRPKDDWSLAAPTMRILVIVIRQCQYIARTLQNL